MALTYLTFLAAFSHFLNAYIHTLLYLRSLYPRTTFANSRFHNASVYQSRHPLVCEWIRDAVSAVREELLRGTVARIGIVVFCYGRNGSAGSTRIMERYMFDVSSFPVVDKNEQNMGLDWDQEGSSGTSENEPNTEDVNNVGKRGKQICLDADVDVDLSEQFRATFILLTTRSSQLSPLPPDCSFSLVIELKDEDSGRPPIGHPQPWIPVQPSLQKSGRKAASRGENEEQVSTAAKDSKEGEGSDLGGAKITPVRTIEAGVFRFEAWIEEGKAKSETVEHETAKTGLRSSIN